MFKSGSCQRRVVAFARPRRKTTWCDGMVAFKISYIYWKPWHWIHSGIIVKLSPFFVWDHVAVLMSWNVHLLDLLTESQFQGHWPFPSDHIMEVLYFIDFVVINNFFIALVSSESYNMYYLIILQKYCCYDLRKLNFFVTTVAPYNT